MQRKEDRRQKRLHESSAFSAQVAAVNSAPSAPSGAGAESSVDSVVAASSMPPVPAAVPIPALASQQEPAKQRRRLVQLTDLQPSATFRAPAVAAPSLEAAAAAAASGTTLGSALAQQLQTCGAAPIPELKPGGRRKRAVQARVDLDAASLVLGLNKSPSPVAEAVAVPLPTQQHLTPTLATRPAAVPNPGISSAIAAASAAAADAAAAAANATPTLVIPESGYTHLGGAHGPAPGPVTATIARPVRATAFPTPMTSVAAPAAYAATPTQQSASSANYPQLHAAVQAALMKASAVGQLQVPANKENCDSPARRSGASPVASRVLTPSGNSPCRHKAISSLSTNAFSNAGLDLEAALAIQALHAGAGL
jgi:hypothetical protein